MARTSGPASRQWLPHGDCLVAAAGLVAATAVPTGVGTRRAATLGGLGLNGTGPDGWSTLWW